MLSCSRAAGCFLGSDPQTSLPLPSGPAGTAAHPAQSAAVQRSPCFVAAADDEQRPITAHGDGANQPLKKQKRNVALHVGYIGTSLHRCTLLQAPSILSHQVHTFVHLARMLLLQAVNSAMTGSTIISKSQL